MKVSEIKNTVSSLPGVGPATSALFANLNVWTVGDLLQFFPRDYEDRTKKVTILQSLNSSKAHTVAQVVAHEWFGYGKMKTLKIIIKDESTAAELIAFNRSFLEKSLPVGSVISVHGRFEVKYGAVQSSSFEVEKLADSGSIDEFKNEVLPGNKIVPVYRLTEGLNQKTVQKAVAKALSQFSLGIEDELPNEIIQKYNLLSKKAALKQIHEPASMEEYHNARKTLVYEELFFFQKAVALQSLAHRGKLPELNLQTQKEFELSESEFASSLSPRQSRLLPLLPFSLTDDQKKAVFLLNGEIDKSYKSAAAKENGQRFYSMRALLQGDVGSGKTLVSFFAALRTIDYGSQVSLMAPTEILARQHAESAAKLLEKLNVSVAYLTGNINAKGRANLLSALKDGKIDFIIGTHALFSKNVVYRDLGLSIIDEQHRFGVMQRSSILAKGRESLSPKLQEQNLLMMSATPIPQTLALTAYGDLDIITIKTLPRGRKEIKTYLSKAGNERNAYEAVRRELKAGHQAYFVYPAIQGMQDDEKSEKKSLKAAEDAFNFLQNQVYREYSCGLIHGKIDETRQAEILDDFKKGEIQILVATTVVEVGVDVPNATCMVIEQADRFSLAALHQLRGRVGRSALQSYCFLIYSENITENGIARMKAVRQTTDGFKIAEEDLKLRGPGEITGTAQSGELAFALADLTKDQKILQYAMRDAFAEAKKQFDGHAFQAT